VASRISRRILIGAGLAGAAAGVVGWRLWPEKGAASVSAPVLTSYEDLFGCRYTSQDQAPLQSVSARIIPIPDFPGKSAIWGALGRDVRGHIWFGVSAQDVAQPSAHLFEYDPATDQVRDRGDVVGQLRRLGLLRPGEGQMKIHSRIVQGEDGHLYFASMDEQGERTDGSRLPTWGSHLWRLRLPENRWEHLLAVPEGLVALAGAGRWINALGYFNHVVHQYDCRTGQFRSVAVGAAGGHISRNLFCDYRGHVYVPRLRETGGQMTTQLVELDSELHEVNATPLAFYTQTRDDDSHGITGFQPLADRSIVFTTDQGYLYRVAPDLGETAFVHELGFLHPRGRAYVASLFTSDGRRHVMGLGRREAPGGARAEWLIYDLTTYEKSTAPIALPTMDAHVLENPVLYGSVTRDNDGRCYVGGTFTHQGRGQPLLLQVHRAPPSK